MKYWQAYTFLWFAFLSRLTAYATGDTLQLKRLADSLCSGGNYYAAAIYYQKLDFFLQSEMLKNDAKLKAASCYKLNKNYSAGISHLSAISLQDAPDSLIFKVKYQCALMSYLDNDLVQAESFLQQLDYLVGDTLWKRRALLLHAFVLNELYRWPEAKTKLQTLSAGSERLLDSIYAPAAVPKLKSIEKARRLSTFFPGMGQCYTRHYGEGIGSFMAITVTAGAMVVGIVYQYYFTSIFAGNLLIGKFYLGGVKRAEFLAEQYNYRQAKSYNQFLKAAIGKGFMNEGH